MLRSIDRGRRVVLTGMAFAALGLGGVAMAMTIFPLIGLVTSDPAVRQRRVQACIRGSFRLYIFMLKVLGVISVTVLGRERLGELRGTLVVANHPSLLDVVLLMSLSPRVQCVVKHQLWRNPFLGPVVRAAGYIRNDLDAETTVDLCTRALQQGNNLLIFPEGTRSVPGQPVRLHRGFASIATLVGADVLAVTITCVPPMLFKGEPWYRVPPVKPLFTVTAGDVIEVRRLQASAPRPVAARKLVTFLETYYSGMLANGRSGS